MRRPTVVHIGPFAVQSCFTRAPASPTLARRSTEKSLAFPFLGLTLPICRYVVALCAAKDRQIVLAVALSRYGYFYRADS